MQLINGTNQEVATEFPLRQTITGFDRESKESSIRDLPFGVYKRLQARISRGRLYPLTLFYSSYFLVLLMLVLRSSQPWVGLLFMVAGIPVWTFIEYLFYRFVLHGRFPAGKGFIRRFMHERLDPLHWEHHARPFDGLHINGSVSDLLPLFVVAAPLSFIAPVYTLPALLAGVVQCYVVEEWVHHSVHFYNFRSPYFRYIKRHHFYHHSPRGSEKGYGLTNGFWDIVFDTRYPIETRQSLYGSPRQSGLKGARKKSKVWKYPAGGFSA
jgi:sterol desaturase/sphingolipid hydroxylase (fatty acid hydroxylase superfamily)